MIVFYIVRHGQTLLNNLNRAQGWVDSPLTDTGKKTAIELGNMLKEIDFDAAYTSDTSRAIQTAELILSASGNTDISIQTDIRLREWCLGSMEAENNTAFTKNVSDWLGGISSFSELNKRLPEVAAAIMQHDMTGMTEPFEQIGSRLKNVFIDISQEKIHENHYNVLIVTHAFAIKTLFYLFAPEQLNEMEKVNNAAIYQLIFDNNNFFLQ